MRFLVRAGAAMLAFGLFGCAPVDDLVDDESAVDEVTAMPSGLYYAQLRHDMRRCVSPVCGGYWVDRAGERHDLATDPLPGEEIISPVLAALAAVWADHPDYRREWAL